MSLTDSRNLTVFPGVKLAGGGIVTAAQLSRASLLAEQLVSNESFISIGNFYQPLPGISSS
jgi:hypothetical protein